MFFNKKKKSQPDINLENTQNDINDTEASESKSSKKANKKAEKPPKIKIVSLSMLRPFFSIAVIMVLALFLAFNIQITTSVSLVFIKYENIPIILVMIACFFAGTLFSFFLFFQTARKQRKKYLSKTQGKK